MLFQGGKLLNQSINHLWPSLRPRQAESTTTSSMCPTLLQPRMNLSSTSSVPAATTRLAAVSARRSAR